MSREIDRLARPASERKMKVVVASASRTGTLGLYSALKILGYKTYHMYEVLFHANASHLPIVREGMIAEHNRLSGVKRYGKADFDKWFAEYDCLVEIPSFFGTSIFEAYAEDPDVKFILTERSPEKWARSFHKTAGQVAAMANTFPMNILKHFNMELGLLLEQTQLTYRCHSRGVPSCSPNGMDALREGYINYIANAKKVLPKDRTLVLKLEDGMGWEQICPFLEVPIPQEDYPPPNDQAKFEAIVGGWIQPRLRAAVLKLAGLIVPVIAVVGYAGWNYWNAGFVLEFVQRVQRMRGCF